MDFQLPIFFQCSVLLLDDGVVQFHHHGFVKTLFFLFFLFRYIEIFFLTFLNFHYFVIYVVFSFSFSISSIDQPTSKKLCNENVQDSIEEIIIDFVSNYQLEIEVNFLMLNLLDQIRLHHPFLILLHPPLLLIIIHLNFYGLMMDKNIIYNF